MAQVIISGEPAGTWDDAVNVSAQTYTYEVDVTGITDMETLDAYMKDQGCMPYAVLPGGDGLGQGVVYLKTKYDHTNASDPTEQDVPVVSGMLSLGGIIALDPISGGLDLSSYTLEGFYAKLAEDYVVNAIIRAMFLQFDASELTEQFKDAVMGSLHAYADAKSQVPVYVDKHGQAYVFSDMVETVRETLVATGAYSTEYEPNPDTYPSGTVISLTSLTFLDALTLVVEHAKSLIDLGRYSSTVTYLGVTNEQAKTMYGLLADTLSQHPEIYTDIPVNFIGQGTNIFRFGYVSSNTATVGDVDTTGANKISAITGGYYRSTMPGKASQYVRIACGTYSGSGALYNVTINETTYDTTITIGTGSGKGIRLSLPKVGSEITTPDAISVSNSYTSKIAGLYDYNFALNLIGGAGVDGVTKAANIPANFADLSYGLDGVLPDWWQKRKALAVPRAKHQAQADDDIYAKTPALPLDIPTDMALDDGYAGDSDLVTEGDIADELKDFIMDVLPTIIDEIIDYAQDPTIPDIPVSDHGDTPPEDPTLLSGASNGLWTIYNPTLAQVNSFGAWLWSSSILDQITRMFNSPIDAVIGFHMIYCTPTTGASKHIKAGFLDSEVSAAEVTNQYVEINCGQVAVTEFYNNVLDYLNTRISIFLPFCGFFPLDTAVVMGSMLEVTYRVDILTGTCLAQVKVIKENSAAVMYSFSGNCSVQVPLTATTYTGMVGALVSTLSAGASLMTGNMIGAGASAMRAMTAGMTGLSGVRQSGSMGANSGALGIRIPYLIVTHPAQANAADFGLIQGLPANKTVRLGDVSGFTRVYATHLDAISGATADEIEQIREMLSNGVIL